MTNKGEEMYIIRCETNVWFEKFAGSKIAFGSWYREDAKKFRTKTAARKAMKRLREVNGYRPQLVSV